MSKNEKIFDIKYNRCLSEFAKKDDLASLKLEVEKLDIYELKTVPNDLSNLSRKLSKVYDELITKVNAIGAKEPIITGLVSKT